MSSTPARKAVFPCSLARPAPRFATRGEYPRPPGPGTTTALGPRRHERAARIARARARRSRNHRIERRRPREVEHVLEWIRVRVAGRQVLDVRVAIALVAAEEALL